MVQLTEKMKVWFSDTLYEQVDVNKSTVRYHSEVSWNSPHPSEESKASIHRNEQYEGKHPQITQ